MGVQVPNDDAPTAVVTRGLSRTDRSISANHRYCATNEEVRLLEEMLDIEAALW